MFSTSLCVVTPTVKPKSITALDRFEVFDLLRFAQQGYEFDKECLELWVPYLLLIPVDRVP
jgi:hypothetical protein